MKNHWPTLGIDIGAVLPFVILHAFYIFDYKNIAIPRRWSDFSLDWPNAVNVDCMHQVRHDTLTFFIFLGWTYQVSVSIAIVYWHGSHTQHPKYLVSKTNTFMLGLHVVGGLLTVSLSYIGFCFSNITLIKIASLAGFFLHAPSAIWQTRVLYGTRELVQPVYMFFATLLFFKYADVWFQQGSPTSVIAMAYAVNTFALVRAFNWWLLIANTDLRTMYDRSVVLATFVNLPIFLGPFGPVQFVVVVVHWNLLLEAFMPDMREFIQITRSYADVFLDTFNGRPVDFLAVMKKFKQEYPNDIREATARAVFSVMDDGKGYIVKDDLIELFDAWGLEVHFFSL